MAREDDVSTLLCERITVGLSTIIGVTGQAFQNAICLKYFSGGSLEIGGSYVLVAGASTAFTWGNGYLLGTSESVSLNATGSFYLAASNATCIAMIIRGRTSGAP